MENITEEQSVRRSMLMPLQLRNHRTPQRNDSICITPVLTTCSSTASPRSDLSITPIKSYSAAYLTARSSLSSDTFGESTSADFHSIFTDSTDDFNATVTNQSGNSVYEACVEASSRLIRKTRSKVRQRLRPLRTGLLNRLQSLSIVRAAQISIGSDQAKPSEDECACEDGLFDGNCLKTFMEMSVQPAEYRTNSQIMTSTPVITKDVVYDHNIFNMCTTRIKRVELHELSPKMPVPEFHVIDATTAKDRCINNNNIRMLNGNHQGNQQNLCVPLNIVPSTAPSLQRGKGQQHQQHQSNSVTMPAPEDGSVLKKVISFTLDQMNNAEKTTRPTFVPEKLHFSAYEQFKGQVFVKWVSSNITKSIEFGEMDLNTIETLISEVCTHLILAGVLKQIVDGDEPTKDEFYPNQMYQWTHVEMNRLQQNGPKIEYVQNLQKRFDQCVDKYEENSTMTMTSDKCGESFASIKNKLLSYELTTNSDDNENNLRQNGVNSEYPLENDTENQELQIDNSSVHHYVEINQQHDCDSNLAKRLVESSTQTEDIETIYEKNSPDTLVALSTASLPMQCLAPNPIQAMASPQPPPPPPPPPPPTPITIRITKPVENQPSLSEPASISHQNTSSMNSSAILSSFCPPPPPPMMPPGPPPLPLPSGNMWFKTDTLRKTAKHPPKPMINLFWTRILIPKEEDDGMVGTSKTREKLWEKIDETTLENADDLTELFARQATPKRPREVAKIPKKTVIKVLDNHGHKVWDLTNIGLDLLQQMLEHRATEDELNAIREAQKNAPANIPLDGPENFLLKFSEIHCAPERIACIIFRSEFEEAITQIGQKIKCVRELCESLMENDHLGDLFAIILTVGNYLNGGNRYRGQADGFGLDVLGKLRDVKSKDKKTTLLHFIVKTFINKRRQNGLKLKEIVYPVPDAEAIKNASTVDFDTLNEQIVQLNRNLKEIKQKMETVIDSSTEHNIQPFKDISSEFVESANNEIQSQHQQLGSCEAIFRETLDYFKHIPKTGTVDECTPSQFFELWVKFSIDFRDLWKIEVAAINAEILQKYKSIASPKTPNNRAKGKQKPTGLRVRRVNQI